MTSKGPVQVQERRFFKRASMRDEALWTQRTTLRGVAEEGMEGGCGEAAGLKRKRIEINRG